MYIHRNRKIFDAFAYGNIQTLTEMNVSTVCCYYYVGQIWNISVKMYIFKNYKISRTNFCTKYMFVINIYSNTSCNHLYYSSILHQCIFVINALCIREMLNHENIRTLISIRTTCYIMRVNKSYKTFIVNIHLKIVSI